MEHGRGDGWRGDIAGLRAVAITPVLLFHSGVPGFSGGFFGVDVFFVISGFLITGIVARQGADFSYADFLQRRMRRILPPFYLMAAIVSAAALGLFTPQNLERYGRALAAAALFGSNLLAAKETRYFDPATLQRPLVHTWSLAIEEQFYLVFPLLLAWLARRGWARTPVVWALFGLSLAGAVIAHAGKGGYYSTPLRAWELMLGALLALGAVPPAPKAAKAALSLLGLLMIAVAVVALDGAAKTPGAATLLPCLGAAFLIHAETGGATPVGRALGVRPMRAVGAISYALYLWHWPLVVLFGYVFLRQPRPLEAAGVLLAAAALATASFWLVERPARRLSRRAVFVGGAVATAAALALGLGMALTHGLPGRLGGAFSPVAAEYTQPPACFLQPGRSAAAWRREACGAPGSAPEILLWGDSYAAHYASGLQGLQGADGFRLTLAALSSCAPLPDYRSREKGGCEAFNRAVLESVRRSPPAAAILVAHWANDAATSDLQGSPAALGRALQSAIGDLKRLGVRRILVVGETPDYTLDAPQMAIGVAMRHAPLRAPTETRFEDDPAIAAAARAAGADVFTPGPLLCAAGQCRLTDDHGRLLQWDNGHLSVDGSRFLAERMGPQVKALVAP